MAMIPLPEAQALVIEGCPVLEPRQVDFTESSGLVIAEEVVGTELVPPLDNTAVDGYAVRSVDLAQVPGWGFELRSLDTRGAPLGTLVWAGWWTIVASVLAANASTNS